MGKSSILEDLPPFFDFIKKLLYNIFIIKDIYGDII